MTMAPPGINEAALWQEVEFGAYGADLPIWIKLADETGGPVLELGAGAGRIALRLAGHGHGVIALERDPDLVAALERSAERGGTSIHVMSVDLSLPSEIDTPLRPALAIGPLHVIQLIDPSTRGALLARLGELIGPGGRVALTVVDEESMMSAHPSSTRILPDRRELDGWVYSSEPLWIQVASDTFTVR
ncbi:MAG TPA: class I SAM-dependent methyltransferase, partial [Solirubrobacterales bacterium]|nr:class I SAM-dependent methyltransferase [Solirubrobacterales bacterium]